MQTEIIDELHRLGLKQSFMVEITPRLLSDELSPDAKEGACFILQDIATGLSGIVDKLDSEGAA